MAYAAQIMRNTHNWVTPSNSDRRDVAVLVNLPNSINFRYGYEEWLFNNEMINRKLGYLECYRKKSYRGSDTVLLFTRDIINNQIYHVATLHGVNQLNDKDITDIKNDLGTSWLNGVQQNFNQLIGQIPNIKVPNSFYQHWNSNTIIKDDSKNELGFAFNINYESYQVLNNPVNLSALDDTIDKKWKRLSIRYHLNNIINLPINNTLREYLNNQFS